MICKFFFNWFIGHEDGFKHWNKCNSRHLLFAVVLIYFVQPKRTQFSRFTIYTSTIYLFISIFLDKIHPYIFNISIITWFSLFLGKPICDMIFKKRNIIIALKLIQKSWFCYFNVFMIKCDVEVTVLISFINFKSTT